jgi:CheY-like chemotaxis protein
LLCVITLKQNKRPMRILVVEDDLISRRFLAAVLARLGHEVITSENGKDGYDRIQAERVADESMAQTI